MKLPILPVFIIALCLAAATAMPQQASAFSMPTRQCSDRPIMRAPSALATLPERSRLESMRMQQENGFVPAQPVIASVDNAMSDTPVACLHGEATPIALLSHVFTPASDETAVSTDRPDVFGSIALDVLHTPLDAKWHAANKAHFSPRAGPWASFLRKISGDSHAEKLLAVNLWVNARVRFTNDIPGKSGADRWSGASETLRRNKGDCEDYAIAKMKLLQAAGVAQGDMYLVIAKDLVRRADHALLVVRLDQRLVVLDNSTDELLDANQVSDYRPIFSYGARGAWTHGYAEKPVQIAAAY